MKLFDSKKNPVPDRVVKHLQNRWPDATEQEIQKSFSELEDCKEDAVAYIEEEIEIFDRFGDQVNALQAARPDHVPLQDLTTYPVGQFMVFYHPTYLVDCLPAVDVGHYPFTWSFYLGRTEDKASIIEYPHWKANGIRVQILYGGKFRDCPQGLTFPHARVRLYKKGWNGNKAVEMIFPPDPTLSQTTGLVTVLLPLPTPPVRN
ncbi:hypothetical protein FB45DRAFT_892596 [Roridomyces roridus]|uniref:Uncharacterized protein n=1 Tax=Roridomyces roridus TaxID=1738132 RepID=A0AAD7FWP0_9AGAR|nr:hypothetical protein FB45DRAFT_892596 [Roridomyces roridus]